MTNKPTHGLHHYRYFLAAAALICCTVLTCTSCLESTAAPAISSSNESSAPVSGSQVSADDVVSGTLRLWMQTPDSLNPLVSVQYQWSKMTYLFYESLYSIDINQHAVPVLADSHQVSADALRHTVSIRQGIVFHDGKKLDSLDIASTVSFIQASGNPIYKEMLRNISSTTVIDGSTLAFTLFEPDPFFEYKLCFPILSAGSLEDKKTTLFPGTGPYRIDTYDVAKGMTALLSDEYRNAGLYKVHTIRIAIYEDSRTAIEAFGNDETDIVLLNDSLYMTYYRRNDLTMVRYPGSTFLFFQLNQGTGTLLAEDAKAGYLKSALSEQSLYDGISELLCIPDPFPFSRTSGIIHTDRCGHNADFSGFTNTFTQKKDIVRIVYKPADGIESAILVNLEKILKKKGIPYKLFPSAQKEYDAALADGAFDLIIRQAVLTGNPDPSWLFLNSLRPGNAKLATLDTGNAGFPVAAGALDRLYQAPGTAVSEGDLCEALYAALETGPYYGIGFRINAAVLSKRIRGTIQSNAFNQYNRIEEMWVWSGE